MPAPPSPSTMASDSLKGGLKALLKAKIGGFDFYVLVDTRASCSVIPKQLWLSATKGGCDLVDYTGRATAAKLGDACLGLLADSMSI